MAEPTINHRNCVRAAKGNLTKAGRDIGLLEQQDSETLDVRRVEHITESLTRAKESFELHLLALSNEGEIDDDQYDNELADLQAIHEKHRLSVVALLAKHAAMTLLAELELGAPGPF